MATNEKNLTNREYTKEEIIELLHSNEPSKNLFDNISFEQKQDDDIIQAIADCLENEAWFRSSDKKDQYQYGANGGMDVADWEMSEVEQLDVLRSEYFPDIDDNKKINDALLSVYYNSPETIKNIKSELSILEIKLMDCYALENNKDAYLTEFKNNYHTLQNAEKKYTHLFGNVKDYINAYTSEYDAFSNKGDKPYHSFEMHHFYDAITAEVKGIRQWNDIDEPVYLEDLLNDLNGYLTMKVDDLQKDITQSQEKIAKLENKFWKTKTDKIEIQNESNLMELNKKLKNELNKDIELIKQEGTQFIEECKMKNAKSLCDISMIEDIINRNSDQTFFLHSFEIEHELYFFSKGLSFDKQTEKMEAMIDQIVLAKEETMERQKEIIDLYQQYGNDSQNTQVLKKYLDVIYNAQNIQKITEQTAKSNELDEKHQDINKEPDMEVNSIEEEELEL